MGAMVMEVMSMVAAASTATMAAPDRFHLKRKSKALVTPFFGHKLISNLIYKICKLHTLFRAIIFFQL
jgi:hypothetical protein